MSKHIGLILCMLVTFLINPDATAEESLTPQKREQIEKLLSTTGALNIGRQMSAFMVAQLANVLRATHPNVPQKAIDVLPEEVNAVIAGNMAGFKEITIHIYDKYFSLDELRGLNAFYATELGRKLISTLPAITQESMAAGQKWGESLGPEIGRRINERLTKEKIQL